jgi:hypothetical protein
MRCFLIASAALGVLGLSTPILPAAHAEETVIIKRGHDRDSPRWHRRDRDEHRITSSDATIAGIATTMTAIELPHRGSANGTNQAAVVF